MKWRDDVLASVVVFLVALPLSMGIAIASGMDPSTGLISAIIGGIVVGALSGAPLQVSGPAAGLTVLVWELVERHGVAAVGPVVLIAGGLQLAAGVLKLGRWFRAISPSVVHGMLAGIGVVIFASQFHIMLDGKPAGSALANLAGIPAAVYDAFFESAPGHPHLAAVVGTLTIGTLILWQRFRPRRLHMLPGPLVAVVAGAAVAGIAGFAIHYVDAPENLASFLRLPGAGTFGLMLPGELLFAAAALAFIASAETLLCTSAVDQMHAGPRANYDRELRAQGVGNLLAGALGALPVTGVIVRSSANVEAGGRTRASAILHGVWMLGLVTAAGFVLELIPTSALAAILVYTGYKLVKVDRIRDLGRYGRSELLIYFATAAGIVAVDLPTGVLAGFGLALAKLVHNIGRLGMHVEPRGERGFDVHMDGTATFIRLPKLAALLESMPAGSEVHLHLERLAYVDHACLDLIASTQRQYESCGSKLVVEVQELEDRYRQRRPARLPAEV
jgi:MFS superfamily sulfate permease-like transporter